MQPRYRTVSGIARVAVSPRVLCAITCIVKFPRTNHGNGPTVYVSSNRPTPTFTRLTA